MAAVGLPYPALLLFAAQLMLSAMSSAHLARMQAALCAKILGKFLEDLPTATSDSIVLKILLLGDADRVMTIQIRI